MTNHYSPTNVLNQPHGPLVVGPGRASAFPVDNKSLLGRNLDLVVRRCSNTSYPAGKSPREPWGDFDSAGCVHLQVVHGAPLEEAALRIVVPTSAAVRRAVDHDIGDHGNDNDDDNEN